MKKLNVLIKSGHSEIQPGQPMGFGCAPQPPPLWPPYRGHWGLHFIPLKLKSSDLLLMFDRISILRSRSEFQQDMVSLGKLGQAETNSAKLAGTCRSLQKLVNACRSMQELAEGCKGLQKSAQACRSLQKLAEACTSWHKLAEVCRSMQELAQACTSLQKLSEACRSFQKPAEAGTR